MRIELGGNWWEIKDRLTRGDRRRIDRYIQEQAISMASSLVRTGIDLDTLRGQAPAPDRQNDDEDDMMLVVGTVSWSWPESVSMESVYARDEHDVDTVLTQMRKLYQHRTSEDRDELKNG